MNVWLIAVGEPLPTDPGAPRLLRAGLVASMLHKRGIGTTWWTSVFSHHLKSLRDGSQLSGYSPDGYRLELLRGVPYESNISFARIRNHRQTASDFAKRAALAPKPDVILCSYPTIELSVAAVQYGQQHGIPVVLDIRDLWPDIFRQLAPRPLRPLASMALSGMFAASHRACAGATGIVGITEAFVDWGVRRAGRERRISDRAFPLAYSAKTPQPADLRIARQMWDGMGLRGDVPIVCFFGTLGRQFDIPTVLDAARILLDRGVQFVICGDGDRLNHYKSLAAGLPNVLLPGWVNAAAIHALMERSVAGLAPYHCEASFTMSVPNKAIEYLAGGLPVLSSLSGELAALLEREDCGWTYPQGSAETLVALIEGLRTDIGRRRVMAENAARAYRTHFVAELVYAQMIEYLQGIASENGERHERKGRLSV